MAMWLLASFGVSALWQRLDLVLLAVAALVAAIMLVLSLYISRLLLFPSWYVEAHKNSDKLFEMPPGSAATFWKLPPREGQSDERRGFRTPKLDLDIDYVDVIIPAIKPLQGNKYIRGWLVPSQKAQEDLSILKTMCTESGPIAGKSSRELKDRLCVVALHGGGRDRRAWLRHLPLFHTAGAAMLLYDMQEHGISDGKQRGIGWATYEADDVLSAVRFAKALGYLKIVVMGTSMGASGSILAAALDSSCGSCSIDGVIAENPFSTRAGLAHFIVGNVAGKSERPPIVRFCLDLIIELSILLLMIRLRLRHRWVQEPLNAIAQLRMPVLIMHAKGDIIVPYEHSQELAAKLIAAQSRALGPDKQQVELWVPAGGAHCALYNFFGEEWRSRCLRFLSKIDSSIDAS